MKHRLLSLLFACSIAIAGFSAVNYSLNESFESGIPATWTQEVVNTATGGAWILDTLTTNPNGAQAGAARVALRANEGTNYHVRLITPALDLSSVISPQLSFAYAQVRRASYSDTLSVYYRTSSTSSWVSIRRFETYQNTWSVQTLDLPAAAKVNGCQLAFEGKTNNGHGIVLDNVRVFPESQCNDAAISGVTVGSTQALISWQSMPGRNFELIVSASAIADPSTYDTSSAAYYSATLTGGGTIVNGLTPATKYYVYLRTDCDDNESGHTSWVSSEFTTSISIPYHPNLAAIPSTWTQYSGTADESVLGESLSAPSSSYKWNASSNTSILGEAHIYAQASSSVVPWLTTPAIDFSSIEEGANVALSFKLAVTSGPSSVTASTDVASAKLHIYVSQDAGVTWTRISTISGGDLSNAAKTFNVLLNEYAGESIRLAFVAESGSYSNYFHLGNVWVNEVDPSCLGLRGLKATAGEDNITLSWNVIGSNSNAVAVISTSDTFADTLEVKNISATSVQFTGLTQNTTYYLSVRQDCEGGDVLSVSKTTLCEPLTITAETPWTEGFEDYTGSAYNANGVIADCWSASSTGSIAPHVIGSGSYYYKHSGTKALTFYGSGYNYAVLPPFSNALNTLKLSFWMQTESSSTGSLVLGYITAEDENMNTFDTIAVYTNSTSMVQRTTDLSDVPANAAFLVFRWYSGSQYSCCIDDVSLELLPNCRQVQQVSVSATDNSAQVGFKLNNAPEYEVLVVSKAMNPDTLSTEGLVISRQTVNTNSATIDNLAPVTTYYVYVRSLCGGEETGEWSEVASFTTPCSKKSLPFVESFNSITSGIPQCWDNSEGTSTNSRYKWSSYSTGNDGKCLRFDSYSQSAGLTNILTTPAIILSKPATLSFYWQNPTGGAGAVLIAKEGESHRDTLKNDLTGISSWTQYVIDLSAYTGETVIIYFQGTSNYGPSGAYLDLDEVVVEAIPTCDKMGAVSLLNATSNSATLRFAATNASQYQVVVANKSINTDSIEGNAAVVYNQLVSSTQPVIPSLEGNTRYYAYVRGYCGDEDYSSWSKELSFKTLCTAITPAAFGVETFTAADATDCWTLGFTTPGSSTSSAYAKRDSTKAYGAYLKLSKESIAYTKNAAGVDTVYSDGAYAVSQELEVEDLRNYQINFSAATTSQVATNYKRLNIGVLASPNDFSDLQIVKTIDLDYAADSTALKSYTVSFANIREDIFGRPIRYVIFQLNEPQKHDSTNYALIDNIYFEAASNCEQIVENKIDSIGVLGAAMSWEESEASEFEVMVATVNSLRPDTITAPVFTNKVSTNKAIFSGLNSNTQYYAYVRAICGVGDTAKWSNAVSFRTAVAVPWTEPFNSSSLSQGWQSLYGNFSGDSILTSALNAPTGDYQWSIINAGLPTGMTAPAMGGYIDDYYYGYLWLISPVVDMTDVAEPFVELTFDMARSIETESRAKFYVLISEDGGVTWKKENATKWESGGDYDFNAIPTTVTNYSVGLSRYVGKKIAVAFYFESPYGSTHIQHSVYVDNVSIHTFEAVCRGINKLSVVPGAESAKAVWKIEGTPVKATVMISDTVNFATYIDSVDVEDAYEHIFTGLTPSTQYYVRAKQLDCANAEWVVKSFKTTCLPIDATELPWTEGFESMETGTSSSPAPECWDLLNANDGSYPYIFVNTSTSYVHTGSKSLYFQSSNSRYGYAILPPFSMPLNELVIDFAYKDESSSSSGYLDLGYMTNAMDEASFVSIGSFTRSTSWVTINGYMLDSIPDSVATSARLAFRYGGASNNYYLGIDDITVRPIPGCPDMNGIAVDGIVADSALISVPDLGAAGYHFIVATAEIGVDSLSEADAAKIIVNDSVMGDTTLLLTGLKPATSYYVYARTLCEDNKVGVWSAPVSFVSACGVIAVSEDEPWREGFESFATGSSSSAAPQCWAIPGCNQGNRPYVYVTTSYQNQGQKSLFLETNTSGAAYAIMPDFADYTDKQISFYYKYESASSGGLLELGYLTDPDDVSTFVRIGNQFGRTTSWTTQPSALNLDTVPVGAKLAFKLNAASSSYYYACIDDIKISVVPSCLPVTGVAVNSIGTDSAIVSFNSIEGATYDVAVASEELDMYHLSAVDSAKIAFSVNGIADTAAIIRDLAPSSIYYAYIRVNCGSSFSEWSDAKSFLTECEMIEIADNVWSENFNVLKPGVPVCWDNTEGTTYTASYRWNSYSSAADTCLRFDSYNNSNRNTNILATPTFVLTQASALSFRWKNPTGGAGEVLISKNGNATRTSLENKLTGITSWKDFEIDLSAYTGDTVVIYFKATSNYGSGDAYLYLDDVVIAKLPDCKKVQEPAIDSIGKHSAQLSFATNGAAQYEVLVMDKALDADTIVADAVVAFRDTIAGSEALGDTVAITTLAASTEYYAYVRALCGENERSAWSAVAPFFTDCDALVIGDAGWSENFETLTSGIPNCWNNSEGTTTTETYKWNYYGYGHGGGKCVRFDSYTNSNGNTNFLASPAFVLTKDVELSFWWKNPTGGAGEVLISKDGGATKTSLENNLTGVSSWKKYEIDLSAYTGDTVVIYFKGTSNWGSGNAYLDLDDVVLTTLPDCREVKNLAALEVTSSSAKVSFTKNPAPAFDFVVTNEAIRPDTLALVADSLIVLRDTIDTAFVALSNLQPSTDYYVYVRGLCTDSTASEWASAQFATRCLVAIPYIENFDDEMDRKPVYAGTSSYLIPTCWEEGYDDKSYVSYIQDNTSYSSYAYSGTSALRLYSYYYSSYYYGDSKYGSYVVLPEFDASLDTLQLTFKARAMSDGSSVSNYASSSYAHSIKIGTMTDPADFSTFKLLDTYELATVSTTPSSADNYWEDVTIYLQGAQGKYIALVSDFDKSNYVWIDDVEVSRAPDCLAPSAVKVAAGAHAADVTWTSLASEFEVALGAAGFALPAGADTIFAVADTTGLHIADLEPSTDYSLYVRTVCGENAHSDWSAVASFSTACVMPLFAEYNFDDEATRYVHHKDSIHVVENDYYGYPSDEYDEIDSIYMENCWAVSGKMATVSSSSYYTSESGIAGYYPFIVDNNGNYVYARSANGALEFNYSSGMNTPLVAAMPALEADRDSLQLEFWARPGYESNGSMSYTSSSYARMLRVGMMTNPNDISTFVPFETIRVEVISGAASEDPEGENYWRRYRYNLAGTTAPFIAFVYDSTASNLFFVDDVRIKKMASCQEPAAPIVGNITTNSAVIRWDTIAPAYQVALIQGTDTLKQMVVGNDSLLLENLASATTYIVKLRAFCSENDSSEWSASASFTTDCGIISTFPWTEDFEAYQAGSGTSNVVAAPQCYDILNGESGPYAFVSNDVSYNYINGSGKYLFFNGSSGSTSKYAHVILPQMEQLNNLQIRMQYAIEGTSSGDFVVGYMTDVTNQNSFVAIETLPRPTASKAAVQSDWVALDGIPASVLENARLAIRYTGTSYWYANIDDIEVALLPDCRKVKNLEVSNISLSGVQVDFKYADGSAHDAHVAISKEAAFDEESAILVDTVTADSTYYFNVMLDDNTLYYVYVRQDCGNGETSEWASASFRTDCRAITMLPWSEGFEEKTLGSSSADAPECWALLNANEGGYPYVYVHNSTAYVQSGAQSLYFVSSSSRDAYAILPAFDVAMDSLQVSFSYRNEGVSESNGTLSLGYMTDITDEGTYVELEECKQITTFTTVSVSTKDIPQALAHSVRLAFCYKGGSYNNYYAAVDDIRVNKLISASYTDEVCEGIDYIGADNGNTFYIDADSIQLGLNTFTKFVAAVEGSGQPDSLLTLNLTVSAIQHYVDSVTLCEGEHFDQILHGKQFTFDAELNMQPKVMFIENENGCEDVAELFVTVLPKVEEHVYDTIMEGETYEWHGESYISTTIATFVTSSLVNGCDSTVYLHLTVNPKEDQAVDNIYAQSLIIAPNPVKAGEPIHILNSFSAEALKEARIEIISATGALVYIQHGAEKPFILPGLPISGVYTVRIIIGKEIYISSLLVH